MPLPEGPSEHDVYDIYQMTYGGDPKRTVHNNYMLLDMHDGPMPLDFNVWIAHNRHRTFLVDTGFGPRAAAERGRPIDFDPIDGLNRIGVDTETLADVFITHLHFDHAGSIDRFAKARFHIQDGEVAYATGRCMCDRFERRPFDVEDVVALVRHTYADRVVFHDGDEPVFPGVSVHKFPGHSAAMQAVRVNTRRGPVVLASDVTHFWANVLNMKPFNLTINVSQTLDSYRRLLALAGEADRIIPGHDPKVKRVFPKITVDTIDLYQLHADPLPYDIADLRRTDDF